MVRHIHCLAVAVSLVGVFACEPEATDVITTPLDELPDIAGDYDAAITDVEGCDGEHDLTWLQGPLLIDGPPDALVFGFDGGATLEGAIDSSFAFDVAGTTTQGDTSFDVFVAGIAYIGNERWVLDADVTADVIDSTGQATTCTLTGLLEALQVP